MPNSIGNQAEGTRDDLSEFQTTILELGHHKPIDLAPCKAAIPSVPCLSKGNEPKARCGLIQDLESASESQIDVPWSNADKL